MTITEMLNKVQYVTDTEGTRQAVIVDLAIWEELIEHLRDIENETRWDELFNQHPEVLEQLAEEARADRAAGRTRELDPDQL